VNAPEARYCSDCGTPLVMRCRSCASINARTRDVCHHCGTPLHTSPAGRAAAGPPAPGPVIPLLTHPGEDPVPLNWHLDLRYAELATVPMALAGAAAVREAMVADPEAPRREPAPPAAAETPADRAEAKARRRAAVRRAQLRRHATPAPPAVRDVLVLEADPTARAQLCSVLEAFGFRPHVAVSVAEAEGLSRRCQHVAAFLGLGDDVQPAAELCRRLRDTPRLRPTALIAIGARDRHADRVRLQLAGADQVLLRPVGRGDVARALEACGLGLPRDPRHGATAMPDA
jgi:CheY-like chemotaxis protein